jgi:tetratricopeptide (TPR) repeat protein
MLRTWAAKGGKVKLSYRKLSILLVDPVKQAVDTLQDFLKDYQFYRVWTAATAEEAWKILKEKPLDLVVTGWKMKPASGFMLVEWIRGEAQLRGLTVLMMRERRDEHAEKKGREVGVNGFVPLPLEAKSTREVVDAALAPFVDETEEAFLQHMNEARLAARKEKWDRAAQAYQAALEVKNDEEAQLGLGRILLSQEELGGAERAFMAAIRLNPRSLRGFLGLAEVYQAAGRLEDALKVLKAAGLAAKRLEESGATQAGINYQIGEVALKLQRLQEALGFFQAAGGLDEEDAELQVKMGDALSRAGHAAESEQFYQRALEMDPKLAHVYNRLGITYRKQGKLELALSLYRRALKVHPEDENLYYNIARCHWDMSQFEPAARFLAQAMKINPEFPEAKALLDVVLQKLGYGQDGAGGAGGAR